VTMMRTMLCSVLGILLGTAVLSAHHSFAAQYDADKPITLSGTVVRIEWTNPHFHFYVDVKDDKGAVTEWAFEGYPPNMLVRQGWKKDVSLKPGMTVTVQGWRARVEPHLIAAREVTFADGSKLTAGPPAGTGGQ
jgi:hypothetical protein